MSSKVTEEHIAKINIPNISYQNVRNILTLNYHITKEAMWLCQILLKHVYVYCKICLDIKSTKKTRGKLLVKKVLLWAKKTYIINNSDIYITYNNLCLSEKNTKRRYFNYAISKWLQGLGWCKKAYDATITFATKVKEFRLKICTTFGFWIFQGFCIPLWTRRGFHCNP